MGIKSNFNKFLKGKCPEIFELVHLTEYRYKKVAIDTSLYMCKYRKVMGDNWLTGFVNLIACLRRNELHSVFIFDGESPIEKEEEQKKRQASRDKQELTLYQMEEAYEVYLETGVVEDILKEIYGRRRSPNRLLRRKRNDIDMDWIANTIKKRKSQAVTPDKEDYELVKKLFKILKVPYYTAPWEAEKMCSKLCIDGLVDAVLSDDTDVLAYNAPVFITKLNVDNDTCTRITNETILEGVDMDSKEFLDFCIMCGTDYNSNMPRVGSATAYKLLYTHKTIENVGMNTKHDISILKHKRGRELFTEFEDYDITYIPHCGKPDLDQVRSFMNKYNIRINTDKLRRDFIQQTTLTFE